jgi:6-phosphogluconolactonase
MYVNAEMGNKALVYKDFELIQEISTIPADFTGENTTAAIKISPDKKYLAVSNRGHDSIAYYRIGADGKLTLLDFIKTGKRPRDFAFSPDGRWILAGSEAESFVRIYKIDGEKAADTGKSVSIPYPVCVLFGD